MEINSGSIIRNDVNVNAMGGSEIIATALANKINPSLLQHFQIINSRVRTLDETKLRVFLAHDLVGDPESKFLKDDGHAVFHKLVFVSNWQMQEYIRHYDIPWSKCIVLQNAIEPIPVHEKPRDKIKLAYWSTPHRGLDILAVVFKELCKKYDNIELDVFSSFKIYGWEQRDQQYSEVIDFCKNHPKINYHGSVDNTVIRKSLESTHILAYPSTWRETSCIVLMEAMSAGLACVHSNFAALPETAANWTYMYQYNQDAMQHANQFYKSLDDVIGYMINDSDLIQTRLNMMSAYANEFYSWTHRIPQWESMLVSLLNEPRALPAKKEANFTYKIG